MGLNVSASTGHTLENNELLRNAARNILNRTNCSAEASQKIIEKTLFDNDTQMKEIYTNSQLSVLKASTQISINDSLKETLKYLRTHSSKKKIEKKHILGELWNIVATNNEESENNPFRDELYNFQIDENAKNIFAA